jgi:hypothetical protein
MKLKIRFFSLLIVLGTMLQINAQKTTRNLSYALSIRHVESTSLNIKQNVQIINNVGILIMPQMDGLFSKILNENVEGINIKNYFMDFDFGFNFGLNYKLAQTLTVDALYNVGMIKFNMINSCSIPAPYVKISLNYFIF